MSFDQPPTTPDLYYDLPEAIYHADTESLSSSGARTLLRPGGPELFKYQRENGSGRSEHYDFGLAAHSLLLGTGAEVVEIEARDWKTKAAQEERKAAYTEGKVPLLSATLRQVEEMVATARRHPIVAELLVGGKPEVSAYALDEETWTMLRARFDYLREESPREYLFVDYKTTSADAAPAVFASSSAKFRYPIQDAFYRIVLRLLGYRVSRSLWIAQEKEPPYRLTVNEHQPGDLALAEQLVRKAIDIYAECVAADHWPGYGTDINPITMPAWAIREWEALLA
ncbi:PD-(D/E)XK nuclease-like domain-containing protein [Nocardia beijingensis]